MLDNVSLAPFTTLGIGGPARFFAEAQTEPELLELLHYARQHCLPVFVLGGGSNLVVSDSGFPGLVIRPLLTGVSFTRDAGRVYATVAAGEDWDGFVRQAVLQNLAGVECLAGIPGTTGATPVQNVGAYGQEVAETIVRVRAIERSTGMIHELNNADCRFAYRQSRFNRDETDRWIITAVTFALTPGAVPGLKYADLKTYFAGQNAPSLADVYQAVRHIRAQKGMVIDADDPDSRSAGSFFKNPTLTAGELALLSQRGDGPVPHYPQSTGMYKVPAAWLIEKAGFRKGQPFGEGRVAISSKHVLALVNRGNATAHEVVTAARRIQAGVREYWGVPLTPEPLFVGFEDHERP